MSRRRPIAVLLLALVLCGCAAVPIEAPPPPPAPLAWETAIDADAAAPATTAAGFWATFGSATLQQVLQRAAQANPDLQIAAHHLQIARDTAAAMRAQQRPQFSFNAGPVDTAATSLEHPDARRQSPFELAFTASYELDLWGRLRQLSASAEADAQAQAFDADAARISILVAVARNYFDLAQADDAALLLHRRIALAAEHLALEQARQDAGRIGAEPVAVAQAEIEALHGQQDQLRRQRRSGEWQLALLLDHPPEDFALPAAPLRAQLRLPQLPAGLPSALLQRRPDLRAAAARLQAAQARIGAARAEQFPQITLTAQLGLVTDILHRAASGALGLFGIGPELNLPIADGGTRIAGLDIRRQEADIAALEYRKAAYTAFTEVERALQLRQAAQTQLLAVRAAAEREHRATQGLDAALAAGRVSRLALIAAGQHRLDLEQTELDSYRAQLDSLLAVFEALGGSWTADASAEPS